MNHIDNNEVINRIDFCLYLFKELGYEPTSDKGIGACVVGKIMWDCNYNHRDYRDNTHIDYLKGYSLEDNKEIFQHLIENLEDEDVMVDWNDKNSYGYQPYSFSNPKDSTCPICCGEIEHLLHLSENLDEDGVAENGLCSCCD